MIIIDGAAKSGSGTIVRYSVALASLLGEEIRIKNIRAGRDKPGLRAQHLKVVQALPGDVPWGGGKCLNRL